MRTQDRIGAMVFMVVAAYLTGMAAVQAGPGRPAPNARFRHADRNRDGRISAREWRNEKRFEHRQKAKADRPWERKADRNNDGVVGPAEMDRARAARYLKTRSDVNRPWETKADRNNDGKVDAAELRAYHRSLLDANKDGKIDPKERKRFWMTKRARVNTEWEKRHDANGDGVISGDEAREMLRDRLTIINTHGKAKVDSAIESGFDADNDGVIDKEEAGAVRDALGLADPVDAE